MKSILSFAILTSLATALYADENADLITIKGLNVDSSLAQIMNVLGECRVDPEYKNSFVCGEDESSSSNYNVNDNGDITHISLSCKIINGCEYSQGGLARLLSESLSLSDPELIIADKPDWGIFMDGPAGDRLIVNSPKRFSVTISAYNYRKPRLTLD
jgi:hypothetical protein